MTMESPMVLLLHYWQSQETNNHVVIVKADLNCKDRTNTNSHFSNSRFFFTSHPRSLFTRSCDPCRRQQQQGEADGLYSPPSLQGWLVQKRLRRRMGENSSLTRLRSTCAHNIAGIGKACKMSLADSTKKDYVCKKQKKRYFLFTINVK